MTAKIIAPGPQTTLQGGSRVGYRHQGVPWAGAADPVSLSIANRLVGNPADTLAIETTFGGLRLSFDAPAAIGMAGAVADAALDEQPVSFHETVHVRAGQTLTILPPSAGLRSYVAIAGGWTGADILGSKSTYMPASLGGFEGRSLRAGDVLGWRQAARVIELVSTPKDLRPSMQLSWTLRATLSAEHAWLKEESQRRLFSQSFTIARDSSRMGVRLEGAPLNFSVEKALPSAPVFPGILQCPPSGAPILLLADGQTTGGYPRICHVIRADRHLMGQLRPGDRLRLLLRSEDSARRDYERKDALLNTWLDASLLF